MRDRERQKLGKKIIQPALQREISKQEASQVLKVARRSVNRYLRGFLDKGPEGLYDN